MDRRAFIATSAGAALAVVGGVAAYGTASADEASTDSGHIKSATAITEVFGDGLKLTAVALEYDAPIRSAKLSTKTFTVADRTITKVYATTAPTPSRKGRGGRYVIVEMSPDDEAASLLESSGPSGGGTPPSGPPSGAPSGPPSGGGPGGGQQGPKVKEAVATVLQAGDVTTARGTVYPASSTGVTTTAVKNLIVDDFEQLSFTDPATGNTLKYNLYKPKGYDERKSYPLVLFMHDAAVLSSDPLTTLVQGNGATCWASPQDQARRPAFVLAPQYSSAVVDDHGGYTVTSWLETTVNLLNNVTETYSIDTDRLYTTGQSMGAIMSIVMDIEYPDLFAASYIVAGQWDTSLVAPMANDKLWITVSQGDESAYPGQNAITAALEEKGATVTRAVWDGTSTQKEFAAGVRKMVAKRTSINYVAFEKGTVVPSGVTDNSLNNHLYTWKIAYNIEGIREWIFKQHK
ncbi:alpha/beta hydrolase-fold protein [Streptomyces gossypiisoli]|uniref:alpha/beta hydrolase-fold protein n=1 Tax=Streptomyces gossypiisoli TaxID=2748864 RepID=UPI0015DBC53E|nr:alpha/beta hydrolase-fold protein [Streptomyces gossypiisoli]